MIGRKKILVGILLLAVILGGLYYLDSAGKVGQETGEKPRQENGEKSGQVAGKSPAQGSPGAAVAPDFTLADMDGKEVRLSDQRGKKVLINFWTTWCTYCREEMPLLQKFHEQNRDKKWQMLTVNITSSEKGVSAVRSYLKANNYTFPVLLDEKGSVSALYGIRSIPTSIILNEKGEVIKTKIGPFTEKEMADLGKM